MKIKSCNQCMDWGKSVSGGGRIRSVGQRVTHIATAADISNKGNNLRHSSVIIGHSTIILT